MFGFGGVNVSSKGIDCCKKLHSMARRLLLGSTGT